MVRTIFAGTGSYISSRSIPNSNFLNNEFYGSDGIKFNNDAAEIIEKFRTITEINERRYAKDEYVTSDLATFAAKDALESSGIDKESLDGIIVAHNFGDIKPGNIRVDAVPSLASRVKAKLEIKNHKTIPYDILFGCPGWLQGVIQAHNFIKSGEAERIMVIGSDVLSRVSDPHDRDSMIYADGAGATIVEVDKGGSNTGIISHAVRSDTYGMHNTIWMDKSFNPEYKDDTLFLKMLGHKLYQFALKRVPVVVKESIDKAGISITDVSKVLIHQANMKMDEAILERTCRLCGLKSAPTNLMPMTISWLGNSSVATVPTLYDLLVKGKLEGHSCKSGDILVFASVGAGLNINSLVYKVP